MIIIMEYTEQQVASMTLGSCLGMGEQSYVCTVKEETKCIKVFNNRTEFHTEKEALELVKGNPHCIKILGYSTNEEKNEYRICMEQGKPNPFTSSNSKPSSEDLRQLFNDIVALIDELNTSNITHGDIHLGNIVLGENNHFILIDFGKSTEGITNCLNALQAYYTFFQAVIQYLAKKDSISREGVKIIERWNLVKHLVPDFKNEQFSQYREEKKISDIRKMMSDLLDKVAQI